MGRQGGRDGKGRGDQEEELAELQKRFNTLQDQQRASEQSSALLLATRKSTGGKKSAAAAAARDGASSRNDPTETPEQELERLNEQIVSLRKTHDRLHESNRQKRDQLDGLADSLKDLHNTKYNPQQSPEVLLGKMEDRLKECAERYDEEHRLKMSYEQVITRLKKEQLEWPADIKQLETLLAAKEADYEQLLVMSHDANQSKEAAKVELGKFEAHVLDERKMRERELQERRALLQKKQLQASELDRSERDRRASYLQDTMRQQAEESQKQEKKKMELLIEEEEKKIKAYELAFQQIKEATGVSDVNEVIQRFLLQEETHQNLMAMVKDSQKTVEDLQIKVKEQKQATIDAEYTASNGDSDATQSQETDSAQVHAAHKLYQKTKEKHTKALKVLINTKSAVQHIVDVLEPLREKDEVVAPMSDDTLLQHLQFAESKIGIISAAFQEMEEEHIEALTALMAPQAKRTSVDSKKTDPFGMKDFDRLKDNTDNDTEEEFEEDMEEDVMDRNALKKQSTTIVDKGAKKKKPKRRRARADDDK